MQIPSTWLDYALLDTGDGEKLERWGNVCTSRPDPQVIWPKDAKSAPLWDACHLRYHRSKTGGGGWERLAPGPDKWAISYGDLRFIIHPTDFKHMGLFPEQAANWDWMRDKISRAGRPVRALNLFGYTGGATAAMAKSGARVTHVDAAKGMNQWAKDNAAASGVDESRL
ncbi:MAG: class I SAM-dependent methyltransferase, partial [Defluviitaleaceae bacterium]|nr:class I SAM-dependent methyltransferase [Defluviitaleaceae bacterium]